MVESKNTKNISDYTILIDKILGYGTYGTVYEGYHINNPELHYAIKKIDLYPDPIYESFQERMNLSLNKELFALQMLKHPHIIEFIGAKTTENNFYIITELCSGGDLSKLKLKLKGNLPKTKILSYFRQIVDAMKYSNSKGFLHRDLKPENIFLKENSIKVADLGLAKFKEDPSVKTDNTCVGTPLYMAPEIYFCKEYSKKCDVWSAGIMLYELLCDKMPWTGNGNPPELFKNINNKELEFPMEIELSENLKNLIEGMLQKDQDKRLDFDQVSEHKALQMNPVDDYFIYLRHLNHFIEKVAEEIEEFQKELGFGKYFVKELVMILKKFSMRNYSKIMGIIEGKMEPRENQIVKKDLNEKNLNSLTEDYREIFKRNHKKFKVILEENQKKREEFDDEFTNVVLNEKLKISSKFRKIYKERFEKALKELVKKKKELLKEESDIKVLRLILKIIKIRKMSAIKEEFTFEIAMENDGIFKTFLKNMEETDQKELISVLDQIFSQLIFS